MRGFCSCRVGRTRIVQRLTLRSERCGNCPGKIFFLESDVFSLSLYFCLFFFLFSFFTGATNVSVFVHAYIKFGQLVLWVPIMFGNHYSSQCEHLLLNFCLMLRKSRHIQTRMYLLLYPPLSKYRWYELLIFSWPGSPFRNRGLEIDTMNRNRKYVLCCQLTLCF